MTDDGRLSMLDEYGGRNRIIPADVRGRYRVLRTRVYYLLLVLFLALPWIKWNGRQIVHLNIPERQFEIFGTIFFSHDAPIIFLIVAAFAVSLMLITTLWGRVWCGWACPQTVFIDAIYRKIETWVEGNYLAQRKLHKQPMDLDKFIKLTSKWFLFALVSSLFAHSFIAYFSGGQQLIDMMRGAPKENWTYFLLVSSMTGLLLFNFGWFREQFCIIMCPYGRFQSVLLDQQSITIAYDVARGEPRKGSDKLSRSSESNLHLGDKKKTGDCVSCNRCVQVCPTGIDIRNGSQLECVGCTACIDACDEIMEKVHKPKGLISYSPFVIGKKIKYFRPRVLVYLTLLLLFGSGLTYTLANRLSFSATALRAKDTPYQVSQDGLAINHFKVHIYNQSSSELRFRIYLNESSSFKLTQAQSEIELAPSGSVEQHLFVSIPISELNNRGEAPFQLIIENLESQEKIETRLVGLGPIPK